MTHDQLATAQKARGIEPWRLSAAGELSIGSPAKIAVGTGATANGGRRRVKSWGASSNFSLRSGLHMSLVSVAQTIQGTRIYKTRFAIGRLGGNGQLINPSKVFDAVPVYIEKDDAWMLIDDEACIGVLYRDVLVAGALGVPWTPMECPVEVCELMRLYESDRASVPIVEIDSSIMMGLAGGELARARRSHQPV